MNIDLQLTDPRLPEARTLLQDLDDFLTTRYEKKHCCGTATLDQLRQPGVDFVVARQGDQALGCGALFVYTHDNETYGEIKRVFVSETARGKGFAKALMGYLESRAREKGLSLLRLETGIHQPEAIGLYKKLGFVSCSVYGNYVENGVSVFMEKTIG